jgi:hypothetical protein
MGSNVHGKRIKTSDMRLAAALALRAPHQSELSFDSLSMNVAAQFTSDFSDSCFEERSLFLNLENRLLAVAAH